MTYEKSHKARFRK